MNTRGVSVIATLVVLGGIGSVLTAVLGIASTYFPSLGSEGDRAFIRFSSLSTGVYGVIGLLVGDGLKRRKYWAWDACISFSISFACAGVLLSIYGLWNRPNIWWLLAAMGLAATIACCFIIQ